MNEENTIPLPWTDAHRREAFVRLCELAMEYALHGDLSDAASFVEYQPTDGFGVVRDLRDHLRENTPMHEDRIDREVAIVRQRAERAEQPATETQEEINAQHARAWAVANAPTDQRVVPCVAALVTDTAGRLLLVRTKRGWELPGGRLEVGETWRAALCRELREETGLPIAFASGPPIVFDGMPVDGAQYQSVIIIARGESIGEPTPETGDAVREARWFTRNELPADLSKTATAAVVREWAEQPAAGRTRIDTAINQLLKSFRDVSAEGESVHLLCHEVRRLEADLVAAHEEIDALRADIAALVAEVHKLRDENAGLRSSLREIADGPDDDAATAAEAALGAPVEPPPWTQRALERLMADNKMRLSPETADPASRDAFLIAACRRGEGLDEFKACLRAWLPPPGTTAGMESRVAEILGCDPSHISLTWDGADELDPPLPPTILDVSIGPTGRWRPHRSAWEKLVAAGLPIKSYDDAALSWPTEDVGADGLKDHERERLQAARRAAHEDAAPAWTPPPGTVVNPIHGSMEGPLLIALVTLEPGREWPREVHAEHTETVVGVSGSAAVRLFDDVRCEHFCCPASLLDEGTVNVPPGAAHAIRNASTTEPASYVSVLRRVEPAVSPMAKSVPPDSGEEQ